ncbi:hypothetical protein E2C01_001473 [Portunus trituberculatus]|uniref:Uncharacterized protein n=1 Tax=Portunus trituberculatus TaxID=210409 RepID=A0A5B7CI23_PORTR|nr:hypothetical protein [Portunus trituberculatus]
MGRKKTGEEFIQAAKKRVTGGNTESGCRLVVIISGVVVVVVVLVSPRLSFSVSPFRCSHHSRRGKQKPPCLTQRLSSSAPSLAL